MRALCDPRFKLHYMQQRNLHRKHHRHDGVHLKNRSLGLLVGNIKTVVNPLLGLEPHVPRGGSENTHHPESIPSANVDRSRQEHPPHVPPHHEQHNHLAPPGSHYEQGGPRLQNRNRWNETDKPIGQPIGQPTETTKITNITNLRVSGRDQKEALTRIMDPKGPRDLDQCHPWNTTYTYS